MKLRKFHLIHMKFKNICTAYKIYISLLGLKDNKLVSKIRYLCDDGQWGV